MGKSVKIKFDDIRALRNISIGVDVELYIETIRAAGSQGVYWSPPVF